MPQSLAPEQIQALKQQLENNPFARMVGIEMQDLARDYAKLSIRLRPEFLNPLGAVHGGLLFTLADCCSGTTARTDGRRYVTQSGGLNYLRNVSEGTVVAESRVIRRGRTVCVIDVEVKSVEQNLLLAEGIFTMYTLHG